jgi:hypothetical protein
MACNHRGGWFGGVGGGADGSVRAGVAIHGTGIRHGLDGGDGRKPGKFGTSKRFCSTGVGAGVDYCLGLFYGGHRMDKGKQITVEPVQWCEEAARILQEAMPTEPVEVLRGQIEDAGAVLFRVSGADGLIGFYLLRVDPPDEGVFVAGAGAKPGIDLTALVVPLAEKQFKGCASIRIHACRPGMARKLARQGYTAEAIVMRKRIIQNG